MNTIKINVAIATLLGWKDIEVFPSGKIFGAKPLGIYDGIYHYTDDVLVPDYCNDLNSMYLVEETLKNNSHNYIEILAAVTCAGPDYDIDAGAAFNVSHATAIQRAEAFLKVHGKWE